MCECVRVMKRLLSGWPGVCEELRAQATHLKGLVSRPHAAVLFSLLFHPLFLCSLSHQLFTAVGSGTRLWLLGITSTPLLSCSPPFLPLSPPLSPFLPPWSHSSCFITTMLPLHKQTTDTEVTSAAERLYFRLSHDRSHGHEESSPLFEDTSSSSWNLTVVTLFCSLHTFVCLDLRDKVNKGYLWSLLLECVSPGGHCVFGDETVKAGPPLF